MKKYRIAMIGVGGIAGSHYKMLSELADRCEVIGMSDTDADRLQARHEEWGYKPYESLDALLAE